MDTNRFRKRSDYIQRPVRRPSPSLDKFGELRQSSKVKPTSPIPIMPTTNEPMPVQPPDHIPTAKSQVDQETKPEVATPAQQPAQPPIQATISLQLNLPKLHRPKLPELPYKKIGKWAIIFLVSIAVLVSVLLAVKHFFFHPKPIVSFGNSRGVLASASLMKPSFTPLAPKSKPQLASGGAEGTAFDGTRDTYSYTDALNGTPFVVSQQPLPANFSSPTQAINTIAKSMGATTAIPTTGITAFMATSTKSSTQTIVFSMNNLLLFIQSNFPHDASTWGQYIDSLQQ